MYLSRVPIKDKSAGVNVIHPGGVIVSKAVRSTFFDNLRAAGLNGVKLIGVILGSEDRRDEMKELLGFGFSSYGITIPRAGEN